jgi:hypothetical protein
MRLKSFSTAMAVFVVIISKQFKSMKFNKINLIYAY